MLREYENSIFFVEKSLYIHKYMYISYEIKRRGYNLIYKNDINKVHMLQKLHEFFKNALQNTRSMKTYVSLQFSKQEKHARYCNNV